MDDDEGRAQFIEAARHLDEELLRDKEVRALLDATADRFKQALELVQWIDVQRELLAELLTEALDCLERGNDVPADLIERGRNVLAAMRP